MSLSQNNGRDTDDEQRPDEIFERAQRTFLYPSVSISSRARRAAAILGTVPAVVLGGVGTVAVALLWMKLFPTLRQVGRLNGAIAP